MFQLERRSLIDSTVYYQTLLNLRLRCDLDERHATEIVFPLDESVLLPMKSVSKIKNEIKLFTSLDDTETPKKGTLIAIDCEFVTLNAEETELRSDGTNAVVRPSHSAVARVTAIRGDGENEVMFFFIFSNKKLLPKL
jgi:hypothetical protein